MIFITGANGLVGSFLTRKLLSEGYQVRALKRAHSDLSLLADVAHLIEWVEGDLSDISLLEKSLIGIDRIIHSAAIISYAPQLKEEMMIVNVDGTANLINAALNNHIQKFCYISSISALGKNKHVKVISESATWENSPGNSNYGISKYLGEMEVWRGMEEGLPAVIVNPSIILGPGNWTQGSSKLFKYVFDEKLFYPAGNMNYIDVRDVTAIVLKLLFSEHQNERFILNAGKIKYKEFFNKIAQVFQKRPPYFKATPVLSGLAWRIEAVRTIFTGNFPLITKETIRLSGQDYYYDNNKIKKLFNYEFHTLEETIEWMCRSLEQRYVNK